MSVNIEKMRSDMATQQKWETRKFGVQLVVGAAACVGAGVALANYVNSHRTADTPPPQIIYLQPGPPPPPVAPRAKP